MATVSRRSPPARKTASTPTSSGYRGAEGRRKMQEEEEAAAARREASSIHTPFRFFCPVGEEREYIIVDDAPDFFRFEHNLKDRRSGKYSVFCACINDNANCPVCKVSDRPSYFAMYLTIIDLTPYESASGEQVEWSKKLLVVKPAQQKKFTRLHERHGTLRGMLMKATRDGEKDAAIGNDQEFLEFIDEDELLTYESEYTDKKDKVHEVIGHEVFDYEELFPYQTEQQLRALVGGVAEPGSRDDDERGSRSSRRPSRGGNDDWDDAPSRPSSRRTREEPADEDDAPPRRGSARPAPRTPTRAPTRSAREQEPEDEVEDTAPAPRRGAARSEAAPARAASMRRSRAAPTEEPDDDTGDDAPQRRSAVSLAERRKALRRQ